MENNEAKEYRLYQYSDGTLQKVGKGLIGPRPHKFKNFGLCAYHVSFLRDKHKYHLNTQFVVVEWFGAYDSKIFIIL